MYNILKFDLRKGGEDETSTPYGLYLDVTRNDGWLGLVEKIASWSEQLRKWYYIPNPYHPDYALAFEDLNEAGYVNETRHLDNRALFIKVRIDYVSLVEMQPGKTHEFARFSFYKSYKLVHEGLLYLYISWKVSILEAFC